MGRARDAIQSIAKGKKIFRLDESNGIPTSYTDQHAAHLAARNRWPNGQDIAFHQRARVAIFWVDVMAVDQDQMHELGRQTVGLDDLHDAGVWVHIKLHDVAAARFKRQIVSQRGKELERNFHGSAGGTSSGSKLERIRLYFQF
jgi:hypothetical protein